jgi:hypothetical protein
MHPATAQLILSILKESPLYAQLSAKDRDSLLSRMESYGTFLEPEEGPGPGTDRTEVLFLNTSREDH